MSTHGATARLALAALAAALLVAPGVAQAKVSAALSGQLLTVSGGKGSDRVTVAASAGLVKVNRKDPRTGPVACSAVSEVDAVMGRGNDRVDLSGVGPDAASASGTSRAASATAPARRADLGPGNDTLSSAAPPPSTSCWPAPATTS